MAVVSRDMIKSWFKRGLKPTESQFANTYDSFWHKLELIGMSAIDGLTIALSGKANVNHGHEASQITGLEEILITLQEAVDEHEVRIIDAEDAIAGKADAVHAHVFDDVTGLGAVLSDHEDRIALLEEGADIPPPANYLIELDTAPTYDAGRVKIIKYKYVTDTMKKFEERFSYDANGRVAFVELKDDVSAEWIRRTYSYGVAGELLLPTVADIMDWSVI